MGKLPNFDRLSPGQLVRGQVGEKVNVTTQSVPSRDGGLSEGSYDSVIKESVRGMFAALGSHAESGHDANTLHQLCIASAQIAVGKLLLLPEVRVAYGDHPSPEDYTLIRLRPDELQTTAVHIAGQEGDQ